ncbi:MAG: PEP-CTERM sorting domain-containing protein [Rhodocyclaceae bacterium]|nr:PEP-CTERM sorting domain-containing protein [Rhodocyclaceae bacterium]
MPSTAPSTVREPATWALLLGAMGLLGWRRRTSRRAVDR